MATLPGLSVGLTLNSAVFTAETRRVGAAINRLGQQVNQQSGIIETGFNRVQNQARQLRVAFAALGAGLVLREVVRAVTDMERINNTLRAGTGSATAATQAFGFVRAEAQRLGLDLRTAADQFGALSAAARGTALQGQGTRDIFTAVSEAMTVLGRSSDQTQGALLAIQQIISKGTVQAEELRGQLGERLPGAFQLAARSVGVTTQELGKMLERGEVISDEFLPKFAAELRKTFGPGAAQAAQSLQASLNRLNTAIFEFAAQVGQGGVAQAISEFSAGLTSASQGADNAARSFGAALGGALRLAGSAALFALEHIDALSAALAGLLAFKAATFFLGVASAIHATAVAMLTLNAAVLANPFTTIAAVVGAAVAALVFYRNETVRIGETTFRVGDVVAAVWVAVKEAVLGVLTGVGQLANALIRLTNLDFQGAVDAWNASAQGLVRAVMAPATAFQAFQDAIAETTFEEFANSVQFLQNTAVAAEEAADSTATLTEEVANLGTVAVTAQQKLSAALAAAQLDQQIESLNDPALQQFAEALRQIGVEFEIIGGFVHVQAQLIPDANRLLQIYRAQAQALAERTAKERAATEAASAAARAQEERARAAQRTADEQQRVQEEAARRTQDLLQRPFENALDNIQNTTTDTFENIYSGGVTSFKDLAAEVTKIFTRLAAELTTLLIFQPQLLSSFGGGGSSLASQLGFAAGGLPQQPVFTGAPGLQAGQSVTPITQAGAVAGPTTTGAGGFLTPGVLGAGLAGIGVGTIAGGLTGGSQVGSLAGSTIGAIAGGAIGTAIPIIGTAIGAFAGGALGGVIGSFFGGGDSPGDANNTGRLSFASIASGAGPLGGRVIGGDSDFVRDLGQMLRQFDEGVADFLTQRQEDAVAQALEALGEFSGRFSEADPSDAFRQILEQRTRALLSTSFPGISADAVLEGATGVEDIASRLQTALQTQQQIDELTQSQTAAAKFRRSLADVRNEFAEVRATAEDFGIATDGLAAAQREAIETLREQRRAEIAAERERRRSVQLRVQELLSGGQGGELQRALLALNERFREVRREAEELDISTRGLAAAQRTARNELRQQFQEQQRQRREQERQRQEQLAGQIQQNLQSIPARFDALRDPLKALRTQIRFENLNPAQQFEAAQEDFERIAQRAARGNLNAIAELPGAAQLLRDLAGRFGASPLQADVDQQVRQALKEVLGTVNAAQDDAQKGMVGAIRQAERATVDTLRELIAETREVKREIRRLQREAARVA